MRQDIGVARYGRKVQLGFPIVITKFCTTDNIALFDERLRCLEKRWDTVGEPRSVELCVSHMPSLKAKKRGKHAQAKVLLEP